MKFQQTNDQITITEGGFGQLIVAVIFIIIGLAIAVAVFGGLVPASNGGQKIPKPVGLVGVVFFAVGFFIARSAQKQTTVIQKGGNTSVTATKMIGGKVTNASFPTTTITSVNLDTYLETTGTNNNNNGLTMTGNNQSSNRRSDLTVVLTNNDVVQLGSATGTTGGFSVNGMNVGNLVQHAPLSKEANELATFLGVPLNAVDRSSLTNEVRSVVNAFKTVTHQDQPVTPFNPAAPTTPTVTQPLNPVPPSPAVQPTNEQLPPNPPAPAA